MLQLATRPVQGKPLEEGKIVYGQSRILGKSTRLAELAELGFGILNTNAIPAIPDLERLMKDNRKPKVGLRAIYALGAIGGPAVTALTNALADTKQSSRIEIMHALCGAERESPYYYGSAFRGAALPALTRALNDPDPSIRGQASVTLLNITNVTPELLRVLHAPAPPR
jgi:HEAT repeat protein